MISLHKCNESCNVVDDLSTKISVLSETKDVNAKLFNMIILIKHISSDFNCKFNSTTCVFNQKWNNIKCQCEWKSIVWGKKL